MEDRDPKQKALEKAIASLADPDTFKQLNEADRKVILDELTRRSEKEGGLMGKIFGTKRENASMYVALAICVLVVAIGVLVWMTSRDMQIWSMVIPVITAALGYIFGKGVSGE